MIHRKVKVPLGISGYVRTSQKRGDGEWKEIDHGRNIVTNEGLKNILLLLVQSQVRPSHIEVGTGLTPVAITDTVIEAPIPAEAININGEIEVVDNGRGVIDYTSSTVFADQDFVEASLERTNIGKAYDNLNQKTLSEIGLFSRYALTNLWAHRLFDEAIGVDVESTETFAWFLRICRDEISNNGYILDSGLGLIGDLFLADDETFLEYKYYPRGVNFGVVGSSAVSNQLDTTGIYSEVLRNELVNYCLEETGTVDSGGYSVKLVIQQMIPAFSFVGEIKEAALYRVRRQFLQDGDVWGGQVYSVPFCRALIDPVDASDDICITWEFTIENREIEAD